MNRTRVIPVLLLRGQGLVKTVKFKDPKYVGDPINAVRIFNEKEVDELVFLDITATAENRDPPFDLLKDIAGEAFMPMAYGGGLTSIEQIRRVFALGFEKVIINSAVYGNIGLISEAAAIFGSQAVVCSVDLRRNWIGHYELVARSGKKREPVSLRDHLIAVDKAGAGEILVNAVDRDGTMSGYDLKLIREVSDTVSVPVIACGGARNVEDFSEAVSVGHASAVAAGSMFVFYGPHRAVLINYPERDQLSSRLP
ncbi:AglZ/HisF2 family acetamidino modification protein [Pararhizobium sp.]|uniref:AglZ/HisF2 family acetamidino modification protein n=1 Tax=Pararhizobium sp. TaxID=1977563 RepID=UPI002719E288|nr:AglZ/HisF2 family acetamidino modification protein [Pararhizobium sp.]MDO9418351.1 AglZ/HisF2 family acetamidino modification protein [Pararhizobium sp.]